MIDERNLNTDECVCPCCNSVTKTTSLKLTYFGFTKVSDEEAECHVCNSTIPMKITSMSGHAYL